MSVDLARLVCEDCVSSRDAKNEQAVPCSGWDGSILSLAATRVGRTLEHAASMGKKEDEGEENMVIRVKPGLGFSRSVHEVSPFA